MPWPSPDSWPAVPQASPDGWPSAWPIKGRQHAEQAWPGTGLSTQRASPTGRAPSRSQVSSSSSSSESEIEEDAPRALRSMAARTGEPFCKTCGKAFVGQYRKVGDDAYHPECFTCCRCRRPIQGSFVSRGEGFLCQACQPRCDVCREPLAGRKFLKVDGRELHADCFTCSACRKPISDGGFFKAGKDHHCRDCHAASWRHQAEAQDAKEMQLEEQLNRRNSRDFCLAWREGLAPSSLKALRELGVPSPATTAVSEGRVCLLLQAGRICCAAAPGRVPEAAVNVSYLVSALQILQSYGREPQFSLDPKDPHDIGGELQVKKFFPSWLASTVVGEVLFQADYVLKQLCLGDVSLPGLPNMFSDDSRDETRDEEGGRAGRQWFVIRRAGITRSADNALVPFCEMGVEARRLVPSPTGYTDAPYTDPKEPLVRMAQAVSRHFPEVARQLPAVGQLLEVAKASILARYLLQSGCRCDSKLLASFAPPCCPEGKGYVMEIPTLRKARRASSVNLSGGQLQLQRQRRSMYGGVDLGMPAKDIPVRSVRDPLLAAGEPRVPLPLFLPCGAAAA